MHSLTNVPTADSRCSIKAVVEGADISIRCVSEPGTLGIGMSFVHVGDHMFDKPAELREMIGREICDAIRLARDAGYRQAKAEIRRTLGLAE